MTKKRKTKGEDNLKKYLKKNKKKLNDYVKQLNSTDSNICK